MIKSRVYQKVRSYLKEHGIEEISVAHKAGISLSTFNAILSREKTLYADDLRAICYALDVSPEEFIESTEKY